MKIAISGKGGVGKSTLAAALALLFARNGARVIAVDADPDANLAQALGIPEVDQEKIIPISRQAALIEERTGAKVAQYGQIFKINPQVSDIADTHSFNYQGVSLLVLGAIERGGGGCACAESVLLKALVTDLVLYKDDTLIMDMEAGVEHLGRATAQGVDLMIVVVEPGQRSMESARRIIRMIAEIGLPSPVFVLNKSRGAADESFVRQSLAEVQAELQIKGEARILGIIPYSDEIRDSDRNGRSSLDGISPPLQANFESIYQAVRAQGLAV